ncbi:MAG: EamA family transporter [Candidatus Heimdallarchaeota archaeon]
MSILLAGAFLGIRIVLLGFERVILKIFGEKSETDQSIAVTTIFFGIGALILFILGFPVLTLSPAILNAFLACIFYSGAFVLYASSLRQEAVSLVAPLYNFNILFLLILSTVFLGSEFSVFSIIGILCMFVGLSYLEKSTTMLNSVRSVLTNRGAQYMISASVLMALGRVIDAFTVASLQVNSFVYSFYIYAIVTIDLFLVLLVSRRLSICVKVFLDAPKIAIASGAVNGLSYLCLILAVSEGIEIALAEPASTLNIFIAMIIASRFMNEEINQRWVAAGFIVIGAILLFL